MKLDLFYNGETGAYRICLNDASAPPLLSPPENDGGTECPITPDARRRECLNLVVSAVLANRAAAYRAERGSSEAATQYKNRARTRARRAMRLLWQMRDNPSPKTLPGQWVALEAASVAPLRSPIAGE